MPKLTARRVLAPIILLILALGIASCGGGDSTSTEAGATSAEPEAETKAETGSTPAPSGNARRSEKVEIIDFAYSPDPVTIEEGGKVIWINQDSAPHTATADARQLRHRRTRGRQAQVRDLRGTRRIYLPLRDPPDHARHGQGEIEAG